MVLLDHFLSDLLCLCTCQFLLICCESSFILKLLICGRVFRPFQPSCDISYPLFDSIDARRMRLLLVDWRFELAGFLWLGLASWNLKLSRRVDSLFELRLFMLSFGCHSRWRIDLEFLTSRMIYCCLDFFFRESRAGTSLASAESSHRRGEASPT